MRPPRMQVYFTSSLEINYRTLLPLTFEQISRLCPNNSRMELWDGNKNKETTKAKLWPKRILPKHLVPNKIEHPEPLIIFL